MNDAGPMPIRHGEYGEQVQDYFHKLFPHREWKVFSDTTASPIPIGVEMLYPTVEEPFYLLHTIGMSAVPMHYPAGRLEMGHEVYGELCMILPADWPFGKGKDVALTDAAAWPIWMLMELGRFPHVHQIWISYGFILPNTETCEPFSPMTDLSGVIIVQFEGELGALTMADGTTVELLMPILAYKEELDLCDEIGGIRTKIRIGEFTQVCAACTGEYSIRVQVCIFQGFGSGLKSLSRCSNFICICHEFTDTCSGIITTVECGCKSDCCQELKFHFRPFLCIHIYSETNTLS